MSGKRKRGSQEVPDEAVRVVVSENLDEERKEADLFNHKFPLIYCVMSDGTQKGKVRMTLHQVLEQLAWPVESVQVCVDESEWIQLENNSEFLEIIGPKPRIRLHTGISVFRRPDKVSSFRGVLYECQYNALFTVKEAFKEGRDRVLVVIPTGVGKTMVMAFAPFFCKVNRVLIITPNVNLADQHRKKIPLIYNKAEVIKVLPISSARDVTVEDNLSLSVVQPDICITNSQNLTVRGRGAAEAKTTEVKSQVIKYIKHAQPDLILIDEGHHFPQDTIKAFLAELRRCEVPSKLILLTATPCRGDGVRYDLDSEAQLYVFPRAEAMKCNYIKKVTPIYVPVVCEETGRKEWATHPGYLNPLLEESAKQLRDMRRKSGGYPHRLLVLVNEKNSCEIGSQRFNDLSKEKDWGLVAGFVTADNRLKGNFDEIEEKFSTLDKEKSHVDVLFQCGTLGEGYDNSAIGMCLFVNIPSVLSKLSQFIGRCLRIPEKMEAYIAEFEGSKDIARDHFRTARVIMPDRPEMRDRFQDYMDAHDESPLGIFTEGQSNGDFKLADCHRQWTRKDSQWLSKEVHKNRKLLENYHKAYEIAREDWPVVPAKVVGRHIAKKLVASDIHILDLGCGRDFVFEHSLDTELEALGSVHEVKVTTVDFVPFEIPELKRCSIDHVALNICDQSALATLGEPKGGRRFDVAVLCLALMSKDFSRALYHAACLVKPSCHIYVIEHRSKFNILPQFGKVSTEGVGLFLTCLQKAGFRNVEQFEKGQSMFIFLDMLAPDADIDYDSFSSHLEELRFR